MIKCLPYLISFLIMLSCNISVFGQVEPAFPNTAEVITCFPDTAGYKVITVGPFDRDYTDLQSAINDATLGSILLLDAGTEFYGGFQLPDKGMGDKWIIIMSSRMDLLPDDEIRADPLSPTGNNEFPFQQDAMPKIITTNLSGIPAIKTHAYAHHYRLVGLEIAADVNVLNSYGLVNLGDSSPAQSSMDVVPHHIVIDRCFIHGHTNATIMKYGVRLDCANAAIIDSYISDFHSIGFDAQAISGINGPGPFKIINNYLEGSGENILFGGGVPVIPGLVPSDIEIRQNYFYKPLSWRVGHSSYAGKHWTIKNLFELKTGKRVWLDANVLENCWADLPIGQSGYAILLTIRTENGGSPQADVSDIIISNNIIRHVGAGISLPGSDDGVGNKSSRIKICNNIFEDVNGPAYGDQNIFGPNDGTFLKIGEPEDVWVDHNTVFQTGPITWAYDMTNGFHFTNNITQSFISTGGYQGIYGPGQQQGNNTLSHYFPDVSDENMHFHKNVLIGGDAQKYSNYNTISANYFPDNLMDIKFSDYPDGHLDYNGYSLTDDSPYYRDASDGKDIGVDVAQLDSAITIKRGCPEIISSVKPNQESPNLAFEIFPNPAHDHLYLIGKNSSIQFYYLSNIEGRRLIWGKPYKSIDISTMSLPRGLYVITAIIDDMPVSRLVILR